MSANEEQLKNILNNMILHVKRLKQKGWSLQDIADRFCITFDQVKYLSEQEVRNA